MHGIGWLVVRDPRVQSARGRVIIDPLAMRGVGWKHRVRAKATCRGGRGCCEVRPPCWCSGGCRYARPLASQVVCTITSQGTGGTGGAARATARQCVRWGAHVHAVCVRPRVRVCVGRGGLAGTVARHHVTTSTTTASCSGFASAWAAPARRLVPFWQRRVPSLAACSPPVSAAPSSSTPCT